jgi:hypothetical protein
MRPEGADRRQWPCAGATGATFVTSETLQVECARDPECVAYHSPRGTHDRDLGTTQRAGFHKPDTSIPRLGGIS